MNGDALARRVDLVCCRLGLGTIAAVYEDRAAFRDESLGDFVADTRSTSGNDGDPILETHGLLLFNYLSIGWWP
jgi:hypothetical protein